MDDAVAADDHQPGRARGNGLPRVGLGTDGIGSGDVDHVRAVAPESVEHVGALTGTPPAPGIGADEDVDVAHSPRYRPPSTARV